jgi:methionyl-tRNA formyltransferase
MPLGSTAQARTIETARSSNGYHRLPLGRKLRVHFITEDDPLYVIRFFETFLDEHPRRDFEIIGVTIQAAFNESPVSTAKRVFSLYGATDFARLLARFAERRARGRSIAALARREGISLVPTTSVNDPAFVRRLQAARPDVIVSVAAPEIFKPDILASAQLGCINVHSGRLPVYRGMMPTFWQMRAGEPYATVTVHEMVPKLDAGAVLATAEYPIRSRDSLDRVMTETKREAARLVIDVLGKLASGNATPELLDMTAASYFSFPTRGDRKSLRRRGHRML